MPKIINKTQKSFTIINNEILKNQELTLKERGLLITLLSLPDGWEYSVEGMSKIIPDGKDAIRATTKKLEAKGYIQRQQQKDDEGKFTGYEWIIKDKPSSENPTTEKQTTEKPTQLNTNKENTKKDNNHQSNQSEQKKTPVEYWRTRRDLEELIGWEQIRNDDIAADIFEICVEVCITKEETISIGTKEVPTSIFISRIRKLYYEDILHISESIRQTTKPIANPKAYILAALYNEATTSNTYWTNKVKGDLNI